MKCQTIAILILLTISTVFAADTNWFEGESPSQNPMNAVPASAQHSEYALNGFPIAQLLNLPEVPDDT